MKRPAPRSVKSIWMPPAPASVSTRTYESYAPVVKLPNESHRVGSAARETRIGEAKLMVSGILRRDLASLEQRGPSLEPARVARDVGPQREVRLGGDQFPLAALLVAKDRERP